MVLFLALSLTMLSGAEAEGEKVVYLTFDDGPKAATPELLEVLEELDVPATFFLVGYAARAFPEYVRMIDERGYAIGCHTMDHSSSGIKETPEGLERIMHMFNEEISTCLGREFTTDLFRFPGGSASIRIPLADVRLDRPRQPAARHNILCLLCMLCIRPSLHGT